MNIIVVSSNYPSAQAPQKGTFVYKLIQQFVEQDNQVVVVSPQSFTWKKKELSGYGIEKANVLRPTKFSFSNRKIGPWNTFHLTVYFQVRAIKRAIKTIKIKPDVVYCHFITSAITYLKAFPYSDLPVYVAVGEYHNIDVVRNYFSIKEYDFFLSKIKGFVAVSPQVEKKLCDLGVPQSKIMVAPNATDLDIFKPRKKELIRKNLGLPINKNIVLFVGRFIENKGPLRVQAAISKLPEDVVAVFIGKGPQTPNHKKIIFAGTVQHDQVAHYMAAADLFVLPTLHEGSSNVIVEAMASGLPIISSKIPEIETQCNPDFSILIDPYDINQIYESINSVLSNPLKQRQMSQAALEHSKSFDIQKRCRRILNFIQNNGT